MSLRRALAELEGDRESVTIAKQVVAFLDHHKGVPFAADRIERATGLSASRVAPVLQALARGYVIDCDGDPRLDSCNYTPDTALDIEVRSFLRTSGSVDSGLQRRVDRFRGSYGSRS